MLGWLVENANLVYLVLGCAGLVLAANWWLTRKRGFLIGLGGVALLALGLFLLTRLIETDRQQIERNLQEMVSNVKKGSLDKAFAHISDQFQAKTQGAAVNKAKLRRIAEDAIKFYGVEEVVAWRVEVEELNPPNAT